MGGAYWYTCKAAMHAYLFRLKHDWSKESPNPQLLTLPKANKDNYGFLDTVAEDYLCQTESAGVGKVINQYNELQLPSSGTNDDIYNDDNYKKILKMSYLIRLKLLHGLKVSLL